MSFNYKVSSDVCIQCAKCVPTCTIHMANPDETTSPRGFIALLGEYQNGKLELDHEVKAIFESCFLCTNCVDVCPKKIPTDNLIENIRFDIVKKFGLSPHKKLFFSLLKIEMLWIFFQSWLYVSKLWHKNKRRYRFDEVTNY